MELSFFLEDLFPNRIEPITPESLTPYIGPQILKEVFRWQGNNAHEIRLADYH
jgi:predicted nucleotidyltransferase